MIFDEKVLRCLKMLYLKIPDLGCCKNIAIFFVRVFAVQLIGTLEGKSTYSARNLEISIRFSLKSRLSEGFHWPEMSQIKAEISLHSNVKLNFHKNLGWQGYQWIP